jgi:acetate kinase
MKVLIANPGSTSYKCKLYDMNQQSILFQASIERIGDKQGRYIHRLGGNDSVTVEKHIPDYPTAVNLTLYHLREIIAIEELAAVGFKTVHAKGISGCVELTAEVLTAMREYMPLAPVHTQVYLTAIGVFQTILKNTPLIGLFETAFHRQIPPEAYLYGIPYHLYQKHGIRKYGFHGASHRFISERSKDLYGRQSMPWKVISCHLGGSSSVCAIKDGQSLDTSMGMSPQSGLLNANRVGDFDAYALLYLMEKENLSINQVRDLLMSKSGLYGISGLSGDFRDIETQMARGNERAAIAFKTFAYYVKRYIGEYMAILNKADCLVFTGGAGQNSAGLRREILKDMENLGIVIDNDKNEANPAEGLISSDASEVKIAVIPTNEELIVAREVEQFMLSRAKTL